MFRTITPIFSIILAIVIYFGFTKGVFDDVKAIEAEAKTYEDAIEKGEAYNIEIERNLGIKRSLGPVEMERLNAFVPDRIDEVRLLVDLEAMAKKNKMLIGNLEVTETESAGGGDAGATNAVTAGDFSSLDISFGLIGTYDQFRVMLAEIEKSLTIMEVIDISMSANEGVLQQFDLTVRTYKLNPLESLTQPVI